MSSDTHTDSDPLDMLLSAAEKRLVFLMVRAVRARPGETDAFCDYLGNFAQQWIANAHSRKFVNDNAPQL